MDSLKNRVSANIGFKMAFIGILYGLSISIFLGVLPLIQNTMHLNVFQSKTVIFSMLIGVIEGAVLSRFLIRMFGRKTSMIISCMIYFISALFCALASGYYSLIIARFILGIGIGIDSFNTPLYLSEISPIEIRGKINGLYQVMIGTGIILGFLSDTLVGIAFQNNIIISDLCWRLMVGIVAFPAVILFIFCVGMPESPRWLISKEDYRNAMKSFVRLGYSDSEAEREYKAIKKNIKFYSNYAKSIFLNRKFYLIVVIGVGLQMIQQFCCKNMFNYYAVKIFSDIGVCSFKLTFITLVMSGVALFFSIISMFAIDKYGRKPLLYTGFLLISFSYLILYFLGGVVSGKILILEITVIILFMAGYGLAYGPVVWTLCSEIFPAHMKEIGMCIVVLSNSISNFAVGLFSLSLFDKLGMGNFSILMIIIQVISFVFILYCVPETKGESLEIIHGKLLGLEFNNQISKSEK